MPGGAVAAARSSTRGRSGPSSAAPRASRTSLVGEDGELGGPVAKNLSDAERAGPGGARRRAARATACSSRPASANDARALLGAARLEIGRRARPDRRVGLVVRLGRRRAAVRAGAREDDDVAVGAGAWTAVHHAFTSPNAGVDRPFEQDPGAALAYAYDIVCNGNEIGGGSIRIHRRDVQERVFDVMGIAPEEAQEKFGFLLDAFQFGAPPHGGIAFGLHLGAIRNRTKQKT